MYISSTYFSSNPPRRNLRIVLYGASCTSLAQMYQDEKLWAILLYHYLTPLCTTVQRAGTECPRVIQVPTQCMTSAEQGVYVPQAPGREEGGMVWDGRTESRLKIGSTNDVMPGITTVGACLRYTSSIMLRKGGWDCGNNRKLRVTKKARPGNEIRNSLYKKQQWLPSTQFKKWGRSGAWHGTKNAKRNNIPAVLVWLSHREVYQVHVQQASLTADSFYFVFLYIRT